MRKSTKPILIEVVCKFPLSVQAQNFYNMIYPVIEGAGMKLRYTLFRADNHRSENEHGIRIDPKRNLVGSELDQSFYRYEDDLNSLNLAYVRINRHLF